MKVKIGDVVFDSNIEISFVPLSKKIMKNIFRMIGLIFILLVCNVSYCQELVESDMEPVESDSVSGVSGEFLYSYSW